MYGTRDINTTYVNCYCATNPSCQSAAAIYDIDTSYYFSYAFHVDYVIPGLKTGCSVLESLYLSTLECLYSISDCFPILIQYIRERYLYNVENPLWFDVSPLIYRSTSQFPPNISISSILDQTMIERWDSSVLYEQFYQLCEPSHCSYSEKIHTKTGFGIIITLLSMIGGVSTLLHLITPYLVKLLMRLFTKRNQRQRGNL
jgi:hypothetical protein